MYQFSQIELFSARHLLHRLPPVVIHPEVHAAGELAWHRREASLARRCEPMTRRLAVNAMLRLRARIQRRDLLLARLVIAPSRRFGDYLARDYGIPTERIRVVPNPVDLDRFRPTDDSPVASDRPLTLSFVSRMSVRKGVELVVGLSHRLSDLRGRVRILLIGGPTLWSDYRPLLSRLNGDMATYMGQCSAEELPGLYRGSDVVIQPSRYEPFALTVAEALASGLPVVASDEVGAAEDIDPRCCTVFPSGDSIALESTVRRLLARLAEEDRATIRDLARSEAENLFSPERVASKLARCVGELIETRGRRFQEASA
jgi:glycosyltransferase involved in cell wall biosynthesis